MPHAPFTPCTAIAPTGSSIFSEFSMNNAAEITRYPETIPMNTALVALTNAQVAVSVAEVTAERGQPATTPNPIRVNRIDEGRDHEAENDETAELPALRERAGRNRRRGVHEHHLEQERGGDGRRVLSDRQEKAAHARQAKRLAEQRERDLVRERSVAAEGRERADAAHLQTEADRPKPDDADRVDEEGHRHRVGDVLRAREARLDHREARLNEHHQKAVD